MSIEGLSLTFITNRSSDKRNNAVFIVIRRPRQGAAKVTVVKQKSRFKLKKVAMEMNEWRA